MNYVEGMVTELSLLIQSLRQNFCIVYRGQASLQGASKSTGAGKSTGGKQVYRVQASLQGAGKSTRGRQVVGFHCLILYTTSLNQLLYIHLI